MPRPFALSIGLPIALVVAGCAKSNDSGPVERCVRDAPEAGARQAPVLDTFDTRTAVPMPPQMAKQHQELMRDHLRVVQEVVAGAARGDYAAVERSLARMECPQGSSDLCSHLGAGAPGYANQALKVHRWAHVIAKAARNKDQTRMLGGLQEMLGSCTSCHERFKQQVVDEPTWQAIEARSAAEESRQHAPDAIVVSGVTVPKRTQAAGKTLELNGAGVRRKFVFKIWMAALYLETRSNDPELIVSSNRVKAVRLVFLMDVERENVVEELRSGLERSSKSPFSTLFPRFKRLASIISSDMKSGQTLSFTYEPEVGTTASVEGGPSVTVIGKDFADALLRSLIGARPYDATQREALLGNEE